MIDRMTEEKARKILKDCAETFARLEDRSICSDEAEHAYAQGYLQALEDERAKEKGLDSADVKILLEALEDIRCHSGIPEFDSTKWSNYCHLVAFEALARYRK